MNMYGGSCGVIAAVRNQQIHLGPWMCCYLHAFCKLCAALQNLIHAVAYCTIFFFGRVADVRSWHLALFMPCKHSQPGAQTSTIYAGLPQHNLFHFAALQRICHVADGSVPTLLLLSIPLGWPHLVDVGTAHLWP